MYTFQQYIYIYIYIKVVHHGSPILHHGYIHLGKYFILTRKVYMIFGIINHDKLLMSLIFHYIQGLPRRKCPRQDSNPGGSAITKSPNHPSYVQWRERDKVSYMSWFEGSSCPMSSYKVTVRINPFIVRINLMNKWIRPQQKELYLWKNKPTTIKLKKISNRQN